MSEISSYPKIHQLGHRYIANLFTEAFVAQEKIDGSSFSAGVRDGKLYLRSRSSSIPSGTRGGLFGLAFDTFEDLFEAGKLKEGHTYRGEAVCKPKHNTITYGRFPIGGVILFDIEDAEGKPLNIREAAEIAEIELGLEFVPAFSLSVSPTEGELLKVLDNDSVLGKSKIEGIVIKSLSLLGRDGERMMGKYVSEKFKEVHQGKGGKIRVDSNVVDSVIAALKTEARWVKSVQRLEELGIREHAPQDIGALVKMVPDDVLSECEDQIKDVLFSHFWPQISKGCVQGLASWYKDKLLKEQFEDE